jgi:ketosteroid isomerase-like protein
VSESKDGQQIIELEKRFWKSIVDKDTKVALGLLSEPAFMVSAKGAMKFDHAAYRKMAEDATYQLLEFNITDAEVIFPAADVAVLTYKVDQKTEMKGRKMDARMSDSSTWIRQGGSWICAVHTESPIAE